MSMLEFFSDCYAKMLQHGGETLVAFNGAMSSNVIADTLGLVESKMDEAMAPSAQRKRLYNVLVECLQNLYHHADIPMPDGSKRGSFVLSKNAQGFLMSIGNMVEMSRQQVLISKLDKLNSLSKDELKELYKSILNNQTFSEKGGGGLGLVDIARRTGNPISYQFVDYDGSVLFFRMNVQINS
ncbi:MAG: SiaB family protein kinase [Bacteroidales bacterium]|nr:SiaB family protein kinase [Bacteroidales bacterium]